MVQHPSQPGVKVRVLLDNCVALEEFEAKRADDGHRSAVLRWVESRSNTFFGINISYDRRYFDSCEYGVKEQIHLDGDLVFSTKVSSTALKNGRSRTHDHANVNKKQGRFKFAAFNTEEDDQGELPEEQLKDVGRIFVDIFKLQEVPPEETKGSHDNGGLSNDPMNLNVSEKILKRRALSHKIVLDDFDMKSGKKPRLRELESPEPPLASFLFKYGSKRILRLEGAQNLTINELAMRLDNQSKVRKDAKGLVKTENRDEMEVFLKTEEHDVTVVGDRRLQRNTQISRRRTQTQIQNLNQASFRNEDEEVQFLGWTPRPPLYLGGFGQQGPNGGSSSQMSLTNDNADNDVVLLDVTRVRGKRPRTATDHVKRLNGDRGRSAESIGYDETGTRHRLSDHFNLFRGHSRASGSSPTLGSSGKNRRRRIETYRPGEEQDDGQAFRESSSSQSPTNERRKRRKVACAPTQDVDGAHDAEHDHAEHESGWGSDDRTEGQISDENASIAANEPDNERERGNQDGDSDDEYENRGGSASDTGDREMEADGESEDHGDFASRGGDEGEEATNGSGEYIGTTEPSNDDEQPSDGDSLD